MIFERLHRKGGMTTGTLDAILRGHMEASGSGVSVTPESAIRLASVFACVRVLAESCGQLPLHVIREDPNGGKKKAKDDPLWAVLHDAPNEFQTSQEWVELVIAHLALRGYHVSLKNVVRGHVTELLPLPPQNVTWTQGSDYRLTFKVVTPDGKTDTFSQDEVLFIPWLSLDGVRPLSPIGYAREAIGLGMATEQHGARLFGNGARPGGILTTDQVLTQETQKRLVESWEERHQGAQNAHRVAVLHAGLKWMQTGLSAEDSQFLETRKYQRSEIASIFRVPLHMIGDLEHATFSNIEHQGLEFVTHTLMPYLTRIESRIRMQLVRPSDRGSIYPKFNVAGLLRGDASSRSTFYKNGINDGWMTRNEARGLEDMDPLPGLDVPLMPLNMTSGNEPPEEPGDAPGTDAPGEETP